MYNKWKSRIEEVQEYDNTFSSVLWYQARTNTLPLNDRKRHQNEDTKCELCEKPLEDLQHFILECEKLSDVRQPNLKLQQPFNRDKQEILGAFLFPSKEQENTKGTLFNLWKK